MIRVCEFMVASVALSLAGCSGSPSGMVTSAEVACSVATTRVTAVRHLPVEHVAECDPVSQANSPDGYYVLALRAHCREGLCGSTLMGSFAVERATGTLFEWDMAEERVGAEVAG